MTITRRVNLTQHRTAPRVLISRSVLSLRAGPSTVPACAASHGTRRPQPRRCGLTLIELMLALTITAMVALAIASMMGAFTSGLTGQSDNRTVMVYANAAQHRLGGLIQTSRCLLSATPTRLVIWLNDDRKSETVHVSEIRWVEFDPQKGAIIVHYASFPEEWEHYFRDWVDAEVSAATNWQNLLQSYQNSGWIESKPIVDNLQDAVFAVDQLNPFAVRKVTAYLTIDPAGMESTSPDDVSISFTIRDHRIPKDA